ncbi:Rap family tetratricopeptide repeat protein [Bacillus cereus]|uniref:response regulator aspartate phosphatase n=1 Tax=Bacillus cereus TaxID=1396 RepID=UPI00356D4F2A
MSAHVVTKEQIKHSLDAWYQSMLQQQVEKATRLKEEIDEKINHAEADQDVLLYYALLDFRYKVLTNGLGITKDSFKEIDAFHMRSDNFLEFYYYFFKGIHSTSISNFVEARNHYEKAEELLKYITDEIERAEFYYRISTFYNFTYQSYKVIKYGKMALNIFSQHPEYKVNVALCKNLLGGICVHLKQYEEAEEYFTAAIDILQKQNEEILILRVRNNIGWLYASQNLSPLAIRHLSEVFEKIPNHYKSILLLGREYFKLGETEKVTELVERGFSICNKLDDELYKHHFNILNEMNHNVSTENIEKVISEGIRYFNKEELYEYTQEYAEKLAIRFYKENNHVKASEYFYLQHEAKEKNFEKGALK